MKYNILFNLYKSQEIIPCQETFINSGVVQPMIIELLLMQLAPKWGLEGFEYKQYNLDFDFMITYQVNDLLLVLSLLRLYQVVVFIVHMSIFSNQRAFRTCSSHGIDLTFSFSLKSLNRAQPATVIFSSLVFTIVTTGFQLRILESPLDDVSGHNFSTMVGCIWNVIITITTVGYGDYYPKTNFGRLIGVLICFYGLLFSSAFVAVVNDKLEPHSQELQAFELIVRLSVKKELKRIAVEVVSSQYKLQKMMNDEPEDEEKILALKRDFRSHVIDLQNSVQLVNMFENKDFFEHEDLFRVQCNASSIHEILRQFDIDWKDIKATIKKIEKKLGLATAARISKTLTPNAIEEG